MMYDTHEIHFIQVPHFCNSRVHKQTQTPFATADAYHRQSDTFAGRRSKIRKEPAKNALNIPSLT